MCMIGDITPSCNSKRNIITLQTRNIGKFKCTFRENSYHFSDDFVDKIARRDRLIAINDQ